MQKISIFQNATDDLSYEEADPLLDSAPDFEQQDQPSFPPRRTDNFSQRPDDQGRSQVPLVARVKDRLPLVEYATRHLALKKQPGDKGEYAGKCPSPDHDDKTASFYASSKSNAYHCHGCGISGNVIHLYALLNGFEYDQAKIALGKELGVYNERAATSSETMVLDMARRYIDQLARKDDAMRYLVEERKITKETIENFGIGFCWGRECQDFDEKHRDLAIKHGILRAGVDGAPDKAYMAGRLTFPVRNKMGRVVGFGGRIVPSDFKSYGPKYLNTPETENFKKSELLYGAYEAAHGISKAGYAVVLEGYFDVIMCHQHGLDNAVAAMGTAVNERTFDNLWQMTNKVVFCLDGDNAGVKGTLRAVLAAAPSMHPGCEIFIAKLPSGLDPDEFIVQNGADAFRELCDNSTPLSRFVLEQYERNFDLSYAEGRAAFLHEAQELAGKFILATEVGAQIMEQAVAMNASGLAHYALSAKNIGDAVESNLIQSAIDLLTKEMERRKTLGQNLNAPSSVVAPDPSKIAAGSNHRAAERNTVNPIRTQHHQYRSEDIEYPKESPIQNISQDGAAVKTVTTRARIFRSG